MIDVFVGIDLGSTTTKAVVLYSDGNVIGRGITNSRSNYDVAALIVREEALVRTRFTLVERGIGVDIDVDTGVISALERNLKLQQHLELLARLQEAMSMLAAGPKHRGHAGDLRNRLDEIAAGMEPLARQHFARGATRRSDFFRDLAAADYMHLAEQLADPKHIAFDVLCGVFDAAILAVENLPVEHAFERHIGAALDATLAEHPDCDADGLAVGLRRAVVEARRADAGVQRSDVAYLATTGEGELVEFRRGHFYGMTTHARGAVFLMPETESALDIGALHARAMKFDARSRVLAYRMTNQCASGSGQFLENVARYLGITLEDIGPLSCSANNPELVSSICAVLAETDVINMVSRGIQTQDILKGIHVSMAGRYLKLLRAIGAEGQVAITGGLSADVGLAKALREKIAEEKLAMEVVTDDRAIYAGAIGAALWGAYRHNVLARRSAA